jgi:hypothetical protein
MSQNIKFSLKTTHTSFKHIIIYSKIVGSTDLEVYQGFIEMNPVIKTQQDFPKETGQKFIELVIFVETIAVDKNQIRISKRWYTT